MFHGECTITLEDGAILTCLPVKGEAVYVEYEKEDMDWAALVGEVLGETTEPGFMKPYRHLKISWLREHFYSCSDIGDGDSTLLGMEQPIPCTNMQQSEVMSLLGLTQRQELMIREMMDQYLAHWQSRDDHMEERPIIAHPEWWHFHD
ncbi:hypothetical protein LINGRAHAP2_LOCUS24677 [Linum grandiflorum]